MACSALQCGAVIIAGDVFSLISRFMTWKKDTVNVDEILNDFRDMGEQNPSKIPSPHSVHSKSAS